MNPEALNHAVDNPARTWIVRIETEVQAEMIGLATKETWLPHNVDKAARVQKPL
jgi:hypothetical protein